MKYPRAYFEVEACAEEVNISIYPWGAGSTFGTDRAIHSTLCFESALVASLVADVITQLMSTRVNELVEKAYELGWSDKAKKHKKRSTFTQCINSILGDSLDELCY